jgi:folylpolyglutamate synthase/dihydropteroate synthase
MHHRRTPQKRAPRMDLAGARALAQVFTNPEANPPVKAVAATNGKGHNAVVHVTYGIPKEETVTTKGQTDEKRTPKRPAPYTVS